jgi:hypothetical protein
MVRADVKALNQNGGTSAAAPANAKLSEQSATVISVLLHLLRLSGAELVLTNLKCDPERFEEAIRAKMDEFAGLTAAGEPRDEGLSLARHLVEQVLVQIRAQSELKRSLTPSVGCQVDTRRSQRSDSRLLN